MSFVPFEVQFSTSLVMLKLCTDLNIDNTSKWRNTLTEQRLESLNTMFIYKISLKCEFSIEVYKKGEKTVWATSTEISEN